MRISSIFKIWIWTTPGFWKVLSSLIENLYLIMFSYSDPGDGFDLEDQGYGSMKFNIIAGVIDRSRYKN